MTDKQEISFSACRSFALRLIGISSLLVVIPLLFINLVIYSALLETSAITSLLVMGCLNLGAIWLSVAAALKYLMSGGFGDYEVVIKRSENT
ncbi:hypothetical protein [Bacterioplanoides sp.]|uniref:hypothetical protein n=1 Tax=Bacterioplanoides sp. TaxID=2066072 RepID=UPI003B5BAD18